MIGVKRNFFLLALCAYLYLWSFPASSMQSATRVDNPKRIRFEVRTVEEKSRKRQVLSHATIDGPTGMDFDVNLQGKQFKMQARFLTDLILPGTLKVRAKLTTARLHGYSKGKLPLYEEDIQSQTFQLSFDEEIVLLPFGKGPPEDVLRIEITPSMSDETVLLPSGKLRPLQINILQPSPAGEIHIQAHRIPHNFEVEVTLMDNGQQVASKTASSSIEERQELALQPNRTAGTGATDSPLHVRFRIDGYIRDCPTGSVVINFEAYHPGHKTGDKREAIVERASGVVTLGSELRYSINALRMGLPGEKHELAFKVKLAEKEREE